MIIRRLIGPILLLSGLQGLLVSGSEKVYEATWESLGQYTVPAWFKDAKFGLFMHWGPQSLAIEHNGWVARHMYMQEGADWGNDYNKHVLNYGHPSEFGYKDLIPLWKAENWDPDSLVRFFKECGIRYIVPVAVHHDNFDTFESTYQPWNSVNMGPRRDIIGDWMKAARRHGLKFGVSSHNDRTWYWFHPSKGVDRTGPLKGKRYDGWLRAEDGEGKWWEGYDPSDLYAVPNSESYEDDAHYMKRGTVPPDWYRKNWFKRTKELVDKYRPDLLWFDGPMPIRIHENADAELQAHFEQVGLELTAYYYNRNKEWNGAEGIVNLKSWGPGTVPDPSAIVMDIEKGTLTEINPNYWQAETSIGSWFYNGTEDAELSTRVIIHNLCDIVSKNGNLLLNIGLKPDGTLVSSERQTLVEIGEWLSINGEAIYGTRPWLTFGEVDTKLTAGDFKQNERPMTSFDIRYTARPRTLYAFFMDKPVNQLVALRSVKPETLGRITSVILLGGAGQLDWSFSDGCLVVAIPNYIEEQHAYCLKISYSE